ncbi:MATE family efflux transporter [Shewanella indica]|uniref:hypothetical protein n=1 Tax=Shewanella indica TaxID=768528 RepID=UPI001CFF36DB|nr:hypothetical protein [Shewanella indica]
MLNKSFVVLFLKLLAAACSFALNIVLVRKLGSEEGGIFFFYQTQILFFSVLATLGLQNLIIRESALITGGNSNLYSMLKGLPLVAIIISTITALAIGIYNNLVDLNQFSVSQFFQLGLGIFFLAINVILCSVNQGEARFYSSVIFQTLFFNLFLLISLLFSPVDMSANSLINIYLLSLFFAVIIQFRRIFSGDIRYKDIVSSTVDYRFIFISCLPFIIMMASERAVVLVIQYFLGKELGSEAISYFTVIVRVVAVPVLILSAVNVILSRRISISYQSKDIDSLNSMAKKTSRIIIPVSMIFFLVFTFFSKEILSIFGEEFIVLQMPLVIASLGQCINLATGTVSMFLLMTGNEKKLRNSLVISVLCSVSYIVFFAGDFSIFDAVIAFSIYQVVSNLLSWFFVKKELGINTVQVF